LITKQGNSSQFAGKALKWVSLAAVGIIIVLLIINTLNAPVAVIPPDSLNPSTTAQLTIAPAGGISLPSGLTLSKGSPFISPADAMVGDLVTVKIKASNNGTASVIYQLNLQLNGKAIGSPQQISLDAGASKDVSFQFTAQATGVNAITVGNLSGTFNVSSGSFLNMLPPYLWAFFGVCTGAIVLMVFILLVRSRGNKSSQEPEASDDPASTPPQNTTPRFQQSLNSHQAEKYIPAPAAPASYIWETHHDRGGSGYTGTVGLLNGRYEVTQRNFKEGGMSIISKARDYDNQHAIVIIKEPKRGKGYSLDMNVNKLRQEAEYLKKVNHPNIVKFIDLFSDKDNIPNLVVEYIEGADLRKMFESRPCDEQTSIIWTVQILDALEYIHNSGFIHRDLNPGNIMACQNSNIKLIDFGTIKVPGSFSDTVFFKPGFIIPEVAARSYADQRSDIYGVGSTLFYLLTCDRPGLLKGRNPIDILTRKGISQRTAKCVDQALQLDPNLRFQTADGMRRALTGG
jgi:tRNA A-37 threonylcarbamoyl transferase component Bud32